MARKSAAAAKPAVHKQELRPLEDLFEEAKKGIEIVAETNIETAKRVDNLMSLRDTCYRFYGDRLDEGTIPGERMELFKAMQELTVGTYQLIYETIKSFELEEFKKKEMKDYFDFIIPSSESIKVEDDLLRAIVIFQCVQPYGAKMSQLHRLVQEEMEKREANA